MPSMSTRPTLPLGYYGQGNQFPFVPNPNWMSERDQMLQQQQLPSQASPKRAEHTLAPAQDLEAFKADMTTMLSDMLQASLSKFASQFNPAGGQGDSAPAHTAASEPTVDLASNYDDTPQGPADQSEGEIIDSDGDPADSADAGIPILDNLKMSEEEQRDYNAFSLASVSVPASSKRPWGAQVDSKTSQSQAQDDSNVRQARPQAVAKAQSVKSAQSDQRSVQLQSDQRSVQPRSAQDQTNFPVLVPQVQGQRQGLSRPVLARRDDFDSLFNEEEFSVDLDNEAVLKEKQAGSEVLDKVAEFCNLNRQDPQIQKEVVGQSKDSQKNLTVSVSSDSKKRKVESQDEAPPPWKARRNFRGDKNKGNKQ